MRRVRLADFKQNRLTTLFQTLSALQPTVTRLNFPNSFVDQLDSSHLMDNAS
ncbi:hypothetical protein FC99_GL001954 [Levilactobacillus koreensis JCM 16448]|nr:hypothetical protein FC99_GL001954 [Levilactobacillus koreensis JCM 16448]